MVKLGFSFVKEMFEITLSPFTSPFFPIIKDAEGRIIPYGKGLPHVYPLRLTDLRWKWDVHFEIALSESNRTIVQQPSTKMVYRGARDNLRDHTDIFYETDFSLRGCVEPLHIERDRNVEVAKIPADKVREYLGNQINLPRVLQALIKGENNRYEFEIKFSTGKRTSVYASRSSGNGHELVAVPVSEVVKGYICEQLKCLFSQVTYIPVFEHTNNKRYANVTIRGILSNPTFIPYTTRT